MAARYGGEEFVVIAPSISGEDSLALADIIRLNIEELKIPRLTSKVNNHFTVSAGVATVRPEADLKASFCVKKADQALYQAKNSGRNRVVMSLYGCPSC